MIPTYLWFILLFLHANMALSADVTFVKEYTYQASDIDSKVSSRAIALEQVKRTLLEELGTYLVSETEVKNYQLTKDQIITLTSGVVGAEIIDEKWDGRIYYLKAKIIADPQEVANSVEALKNNKQKSLELEESRKRTEAAMEEVRKLRSELELVRSATQGKYTNAVNELSTENDRQNAERGKFKAAMKDIPSAHADEVLDILKNMRTNEDIAKEQSERERQEEESERQKNSFGHQFPDFLMDIFRISH